MSDEFTSLPPHAGRALGRLDGSIEALPNAELFVFMYLRKEAGLSSQIEGIQASPGDVLEVEAKLFDPMRPDDTEEILNHVAAPDHGLKRLEQRPLPLRPHPGNPRAIDAGCAWPERNAGRVSHFAALDRLGRRDTANAGFVPPPHMNLPLCLAHSCPIYTRKTGATSHPARPDPRETREHAPA